MASVSEKTFGQRHTRGVALLDRVKGEEGYDPKGNPLITKTALTMLLDKMRAVNAVIGALAQVYNQCQDDRTPMYHGEEGLRKRVGMMRDVVGGLQNGHKLAAYGTLTRIVQDMRGYRKPKNEPLPIGNEQVYEETRSMIQTSYGSMLQKGRDALATIIGMGTAYKTDNPLVTVENMTTFIAEMEAQDTKINEALLPLKEATKTRYELYEGEEGLRRRMTAVKSYVAGNHTKTSPLYKDLVKIKY
jgi:hypothetical protein